MAQAEGFVISPFAYGRPIKFWAPNPVPAKEVKLSNVMKKCLNAVKTLAKRQNGFFFAEAVSPRKTPTDTKYRRCSLTHGPPPLCVFEFTADCRLASSQRLAVP
jgi:hypothetical protein